MLHFCFHLLFIYFFIFYILLLLLLFVLYLICPGIASKESHQTMYNNKSFVSVHLPGRNIDGANITYMESNLWNYFSQTRHHDVDQAYKDRAMNFIHGEFERFALETELQEFQQLAVSNTRYLPS